MFKYPKFANVWPQIKHIFMSNFHPLEVVGRGSQTQLKMGENIITLAGKGLNPQPPTLHYVLFVGFAIKKIIITMISR